MVALGAAHAYKFAALFGSWLADLALDREHQPPDSRLGMFAIDRPALSAPEDTNLVGSA